MKKNAYIVIAFIILVFGIYAIPKILERLTSEELVTFEQVPEFSFTNQDGVLINNNYYKNKVYVVEFFFTSCPTICPKMHANLLKIQKEFFGNPDFGMASFTIDPQRDSPEVLKVYMQNKGVNLKHWQFMTGEKEAIYKFSNEGFKLYAGENELAEGGFEHSGLFALIDKNGNIRSRIVQSGDEQNPIKFYDGLDETQVQWLKEDIEKLLKE